MLWASVGKLCVEKNVIYIFVHKTIERLRAAIKHNDKL